MTARTLRWWAAAAAGFVAAVAAGAPPEGGALPDLTPPELLTHTTHPTHGEVPHVEHEEGGLFASAEYLLLRPRRGAFDFAAVSNTTAPTPAGPLETLNFGLRSGVRANVGYRLPGGGWEVSGGYTFLRSAAERILVAPPGGVLYPTLTRPGLVDTATSAVANAGLEYNVFDLEVARRIRLDDRADARLFAGGRFASIRQTFDATYDGRDAVRALVRTKSGFDGFGPTAGGEASVRVWRGFGLYAKASGGLIAGTVSSPVIETNQAGLVRYADLSYRVRKVVPVATIGVGAGWQSGRVAVRAGYEATHWFGLTDAPRYTSEFAPGRVGVRAEPLSLEGLFVRFEVAF